MSSLSSFYTDVAAAAQARFGADAADCNEDGAYVAFGDTIVHVSLDQSATRAVIWTELPRPAHADSRKLEQAALEYTGRMFLDRGFAIGINQAADLILLGRSIEQDALLQERGLDLVEAIAQAAGPAAAGLERSSGSSSSGADQSSGPIVYRS